MTSGQYIVAICALGGVIASAAFWWSCRTGQFSGSEQAKYLVFDDEDNVPRPDAPAPGQSAQL
jgi:cbb3-type cytochrome oxidase maturation protein